jgi:hypothetical protein
MISNQIKIIFKKKMILISNQDQRSFFVPKVPFLRVKISKKTKIDFELLKLPTYQNNFYMGAIEQ